MRKRFIITAIIFFVLLITAAAWVIYVSFAIVKPTTQSINRNLLTVFGKIVRIPEVLPPSLDFSQVSYLWEMETLDKEVIEVRFTYTPSYTSQDQEITAVLEMTEKGDPSIFDKVLPALIADSQSLDTARDPQKANFGPSEKAGYSKLEITKDSKGDKTIKISWTYQKENLNENLKNDYQKIGKFPESLLRILYAIPGFLVSLVRG